MNVAEQPLPHYDYRYSPPVSPKSQPHGCKRKASSRDDELDNQNGISSSLKRLRLSKSRRPGEPETGHALTERADNLRKVQNVTVRADQEPRTVQVDSPVIPEVQPMSTAPTTDDVDFMPVDDTSDRVWVHDLNAEIAEIEAEEERARQTVLSEAAQEYSKIPEHLLKRPVRPTDPAAGMQMVLYRDPSSISVPAEEDAVRQTILDTRRRMREKQALNRGQMIPAARDVEIDLPPVPDMALDTMTNDDDIDMAMDID